MEKERLDILLVQRGFFETREKARKNIMAGLVFVDGQRVDKSGEKVNIDSAIEIKGNAIPYVSRGGLKLEKALQRFNINLHNKVCIDVGASTGGFTDCMLKNGALKVYSIDVGYGQLAWELRNNPKVVVMERTNIRFVKPEDLEELADYSSIDVSFISLKLVIPTVINLLKENGELVALIKPQFEAGREKVGKKGVVRDKDVHEEVIKEIIQAAENLKLIPLGLDYSPIKGPEGNIEYLAYFTKDKTRGSIDAISLIKEIVNKAHEELNK